MILMITRSHACCPTWRRMTRIKYTRCTKRFSSTTGRSGRGCRFTTPGEAGNAGGLGPPRILGDRRDGEVAGGAAGQADVRADAGADELAAEGGGGRDDEDGLAIDRDLESAGAGTE